MVINNQDDFWLIDIAIVIIKADGKYHIEIIRSSFPQDVLQLYNNNIEVGKVLINGCFFSLNLNIFLSLDIYYIVKHKYIKVLL